MMRAKFLSKYKVVKAYYDGIKPVTIEVHPSYPCNYNCKWCIDKTLKNQKGEGWCINNDSKSMMSEANVRNIIESAVKMKSKGIIISGGGEPTLNKNTELLVELADEKGIITGMFTNGASLNEENMRKYIKGLSFIRFSFDDYNAENYSRTKGVGAHMYDKVIKNIKRCVELKKELKADKCRIGIDFIIIPDNVDKMISIYKETLAMGVDYLQFCDCVEVGYRLTEAFQTKILDNLETIHGMNRGKVFDVVYEPLQKENEVWCHDCEAKEYIVQVGADGKVRPCPHTARHDELIYGDINDKPLWQIWEDRPERLETNLCYEYCRFRKQNEILKGLKDIEHSEMI